jgi:hypothetical protein
MVLGHLPFLHASANNQTPTRKMSPVLSRDTQTEGEQEKYHYGENNCGDNPAQTSRVNPLTMSFFGADHGTIISASRARLQQLERHMPEGDKSQGSKLYHGHSPTYHARYL